MKTLIAAAAALAAGLAFPVSAAAEHARTMDRVNLRYGPSQEYRPVVIIPRERPVEVSRCTPGNEWCEVHYGRYAGWVRADFLLHPRYGRAYNALGPELGLPVFDFFAHIEDYDRDRRYRLKEHQHDDDWYRQRRGHRGDNNNDDDNGRRGRGDDYDNNDDGRRYPPGFDNDDDGYDDDRYPPGEPPDDGWERDDADLDDDVEGRDDE